MLVDTTKSNTIFYIYGNRLINLVFAENARKYLKVRSSFMYLFCAAKEK